MAVVETGWKRQMLHQKCPKPHICSGVSVTKKAKTLFCEQVQDSKHRVTTEGKPFTGLGAQAKLPGKSGTNGRDLPLQRVQDVSLRIELQRRVKLYVPHLETRHVHFHGAVGADLSHFLELL